jgi:quinol monooxygenase YgiN
VSEVHVVATIPIKPESAAEATEGLKALVDAVRTENGCISYDLYESNSVPNTFVTVEVWESQDALDAHMTSPALGEAVTTLGSHLAGDIAIHPLRSVH